MCFLSREREHWRTSSLSMQSMIIYLFYILYWPLKIWPSPNIYVVESTTGTHKNAYLIQFFFVEEKTKPNRITNIETHRKFSIKTFLRAAQMKMFVFFFSNLFWSVYFIVCVFAERTNTSHMTHKNTEINFYTLL